MDAEGVRRELDRPMTFTAGFGYAVVMQHPLFIGMMSGTSVDGIDVAVVRTGDAPELMRFSSFPMPEELREPLLRLAAPGINEIDQMGRLDTALGHAYAECALQTLRDASLEPSDIAAIGCHGQTIRHQPHARHPFSLQIGNAAVLAEATGLTVVSDFRARDIAAGGEGAPLTPMAHHALFASDRENIAVLNLGGIANITWLGRDGTVSGFDCGPGNMLMDALMLELSDGRQAFDAGGELAAAGHADAELLRELMNHPFVARKPPKSTGREEFGDDVVSRIMAWPGLSDADRMATTAAFTVHCVADAVCFLPEPPARWLVCGGGARNRHVMRTLGAQLAPARVQTTDVAGIPTQAVEATAFAVLAQKSLCGEVNTLAGVTGAGRDVCGGGITPGDNWPTLLQHLPAWIR